MVFVLKLFRATFFRKQEFRATFENFILTVIQKRSKAAWEYRWDHHSSRDSAQIGKMFFFCSPADILIKVYSSD